MGLLAFGGDGAIEQAGDLRGLAATVKVLPEPIGSADGGVGREGEEAGEFFVGRLRRVGGSNAHRWDIGAGQDVLNDGVGRSEGKNGAPDAQVFEQLRRNGVADIESVEVD